MRKVKDSHDIREENVCPGRAVSGDFIACDYPRQMFPFSNRTFYHRLAILILPIVSLIMLAGCASALVGAAGRGDISGVNRLLEGGAELNEVSMGTTALIQAAVNGKTNVVRILIDKGADVNYTPFEQTTALHWAVIRGHMDTVRALIEKGANVNAKDEWNWTPLHCAIEWRHDEIARILVEAGSDLKVQANFRRRGLARGGTPLEIAQRNGNTEIARILMEAEKETPKAYAKTEPPSVQTTSPPPLPKVIPKDLPKIAVWDLMPREVKPTYAQELTSILVSEIGKIKKYEVYSQDNVRTLAGWTEERMKLGCTSTQCLTTLGQMDIAKLISGSVGKIGNTFSISLNLFDTQNAKAEKAVSDFCRTEDELIPLVQMAVRELLGEEVPPVKRVPRR